MKFKGHNASQLSMDHSAICVEQTSMWKVRGKSVASWIVLFLLRCYIVFLSPFFGGACKFYPSCSNYGWEAVSRHGARRGMVLALKRLLRCHPFTKGGVDLVPDALEARRTADPEKEADVASPASVARGDAR
jgi:uncharacterized protein